MGQAANVTMGLVSPVVLVPQSQQLGRKDRGLKGSGGEARRPAASPLA